MFNTALIKLKDKTDDLGHLTPIEGSIDIPFDIKRVYYITKVKTGVDRGFHSHRKLHQLLICLNGSVDIITKIPNEEEMFKLDNQTVGLYIGPMVWREMVNFSEGAVLLVIASENYEEADYIRDYEQYLKEAGELFF